MRARSFIRNAVTSSVALLFIVQLGACTNTSAAATPQELVARKFVAALGAHDATAAGALTDAMSVAQPQITANLNGLGANTRGSLRVQSVRASHGMTTARFAAVWRIQKLRWSYNGSFPLVEHAGSWLVHWQPSDVHPMLTTATRLTLQRDQPARGALLDSSGKPLITDTAVVRIGIERKLVTNLSKLASTLAAIPQLESSKSDITAAVLRASPTDFVPVVTLRRPVYESIRAKIYDLAGTVFQSDTLQLGPTGQFGQPLLGRVGEATRQVVDARGTVEVGDQTGVGGLEQALNGKLAGTPGTAVVVTSVSSAASAHRLATLTTPKAGMPVKLTLDRAAQTAAEDALAGVRKPAALVAVSRSTGRILADANTAAVTYDYGLAGAFPPGSTFKIATWTGVFAADPSLSPSSTVSCPGTTTVDGRRFINENRFSHPPITISAAFGYSCNTSAIDEALKLPLTAVGNGAKLLGIGRAWKLPISSYSGAVPTPAGQTERAADAIGQGRVLASPLLMALMAGAATSGKVIGPTITAAERPASPTTVPRSIVTKMTALMKATVNMPGGTGSDLKVIGGVSGKTGTAEYGDAIPPRTHSWFAGVHGDVAFAVFIYDGATTGVNAVPIASKFLRAG